MAAPMTEKEAMVDPFLVEALQNPRHRLTILRMELDIQKFFQNPDQLQFEFQPFPTSYLRLAAHRVAQHYGLATMSLENGNGSLDGSDNRILVTKTAESRFPHVCLSEIPVKQPENGRPEGFKIAIKARPKRGSGSGGGGCGVQQNLLRSVEERKEEYDKARARIFNSPSSSDSEDSPPLEGVNRNENDVAGEPKRFTVVHVTQKSKPPTRIIGARGSEGGPHPPCFDPVVDMDPRLVVSLLDLPREVNVNALVLRFGGECVLVWLNDKNALVIFHDHARAVTAMRRLDHGSVYHGAVVVQNGSQSPSLGNAMGSSSCDAQKANPWKKAVIQESDDETWGAEDSSNRGSSTDIQASTWRSATSNTPTLNSVNRWSVLEPEKPLVKTEGSSSSKSASKPVESSSEELVDD